MEKTRVVFKDDSIYGEVQLFSDDKKAGKMDISVADGKLRVLYTEVDTEYRGKGFAKLLLKQLVGYARENSLRVIPLCPYVFAQFKQNRDEYEDVWFKKRLKQKQVMKYILEKPIKGTIGLQKYKSVMHWRNGVFITDEPEKLGGKDLGPDPYTLLLSSLVGCTLATLRMYVEHKGLSIPEIKVEANMFHKIENKLTVTYIERKIVFLDQLEVEIQQKLVQIAENCPISKILKGSINISTEVVK